MPASSISGLLSTSVYFAAVLLLMAVVMAPGLNLYRDASQKAAATLVGGVAQEVDALVPGMTSDLEFQSYPAMTASVTFSGNNVTATVDGFSSSLPVNWPLAASTLLPGHHYRLSVIDGVVSAA